MQARCRWNLALTAAVVITMLPVLYYGAYRYMLVTWGDLDGNMRAGYSVFPEHSLWGVPLEDSPIGRFFAPAHALDRRMRPEYWYR